MPFLETPDELADEIADCIGVYGAHDDKCSANRPCRVCFVSDLTARIRASVLNDSPARARPSQDRCGYR